MAEMAVDRLQIEIEATSEGAEKNIRSLTATLEDFKRSARAGGLSGFTDNIKGAGEEATEAEKKVSKLTKTMQSMKSTVSANNAVNRLGGGSTGLAALTKRIILYRALRAVVGSVINAMKEGLSTAYEYSKTTNGELTPALDRISTAANQMKNQLGAAFGQLLTWVEPLITGLIHLVTDLAQKFTWLFAVLSGSDKYLVANEVATSWKEADKAAKSYQRTLLGIDEINRLNAPSSGGGANGSNSVDPFHYEPTNFKLPDLSTWATPLLEKVSTATEKVHHLAEELGLLPSPQVSIGLDATGARQGIGEVSMMLDGLRAQSPVSVGVEVMDTAPALGRVGEVNSAIGNLAAQSPMMVDMKVSDPAPELAKITQGIEGLNGQLGLSRSVINEYSTSTIGSFGTMSEGVGSTVKEMTGNLSTELDASKLSISNYTTETGTTFSTWATNNAVNTESSIGRIVTSTELLNQDAKPNISSFLTETGADFSMWASNNVMEAEAAMSGVVSSTSVLDDAKANIDTFTDETEKKFRLWKRTMVFLAAAAFNPFGTFAYLALESAGKSEVSFANGSTKTFSEWASGVIDSAKAAGKGLWDGVTKYLSGVWDGLNKVFEAMGEPTKGPFGVNAPSFSPSLVPAPKSISPFTLTPFVPMMIPAFATGGFVDHGTTFLAGEAGPEIVTNIGNRTGVINEQQLTGGVEEGVERGMEPLLTIVAAGFSRIEQAIAEYSSDGGVTLSDRDIYRAWQRGSQGVGGSLVKGMV